MSSLVNNLEYDIISDAEVTNILSHFDSDEILNFIDDNLQRKHMFYPNNPLNLVKSIETNFSIVYANLPGEKERIDFLRDDVYKSIIYKLCNYYNIEFIDNDQDYYTIAYYLYEFLVSGFSTNVISFFTNYIVKEKDYIYNHIGLVDMKKSKDMSTSYTKKMHKDSKLALINANLEYVIDSIALFDISLKDILDLVYIDRNIAELILNSIAPRGNFFKEHFVKTIFNEYKAVFLTNVKFALLSADDSLSAETISFLQQA